MTQFRTKTFWVEVIEPRVFDWEGSIGRPRHRRLDTGEELRGELPSGALFIHQDPYKEQGGRQCIGADGFSVVCVTPADHWYIDDRASNCTLPKDIQHRCWVRHGTFGEALHVDKNGLTCSAGAGSIMQKGSRGRNGFHGFLHKGELYGEILAPEA